MDLGNVGDWVGAGASLVATVVALWLGSSRKRVSTLQNSTLFHATDRDGNLVRSELWWQITNTSDFPIEISNLLPSYIMTDLSKSEKLLFKTLGIKKFLKLFKGRYNSELLLLEGNPKGKVFYLKEGVKLSDTIDKNNMVIFPQTSIELRIDVLNFPSGINQRNLNTHTMSFNKENLDTKNCLVIYQILDNFNNTYYSDVFKAKDIVVSNEFIGDRID